MEYQEVAVKDANGSIRVSLNENGKAASDDLILEEMRKRETKKDNTVKSLRKIMYIFFMDSQGMLLQHAVPSGQTVNKESAELRGRSFESEEELKSSVRLAVHSFQKSDPNDQDDEDVPKLFSKRWQLAFIGFFAALVGGIYKANISIAVVCMSQRLPANDTQEIVLVNETWNDNLTFASLENSGQCKMESSSGFYAKETEFTWSKSTQSLVLAGYFYGYIVFQVPGGWFADKYGGKQPIALGLALNAILNLVTPVLARWNVYSVVITRILVGITGGLIAPAWFSLIGKWTLIHERSRFIAAYMGGQQIGYILGYATSGLLCAHGFDNGWGSIFYVHGTVGVAFVILWVFLVSSSPQEHSSITSTELRLLTKHLAHDTEDQTLHPLTVPWKKIVTSAAVWAVFFVHMCDNWIYYLICNCLPMFLEEVLMLDIQNNGFYSSVPFITNTFGLFVASTFADFVISKGCFSRTTTRKLFQIPGQVLGSSFLIAASYVTCDKREIVIFLIGICMFVTAFGMTSGYSANFVDMAPRYAGILYAISNTMATIPGMFAPLAVAELTRNGTSAEWQVVFYMAAAFVLLGCFVYGFFSSSEPVSWATETVDTTLEVPLKQGFKDRGDKKRSSISE